jgi:hypothetical protein
VGWDRTRRGRAEMRKRVERRENIVIVKEIWKVI